MTFLETLARSLKGMFPGILLWLVLPLIPFIIAEQLFPVGRRPRWRDYAMNVLISLSTSVLTLPAGIAAGLVGGRLRQLLPWRSWSFSFDSLGQVPVAGPALEVLAMIFVPVLLHDLWFYWAHRSFHKVPFLWAFHKLHHSDERMNCATFARDQFLQATLTAFFPIFTLGLFLDLDLVEAGKTALYSRIFVVVWTMFYHSAIRVQLPWLDRVLVTPQLHRLHHSLDPAVFNTNFADALPIFDILFGTYRRPRRNEFSPTGLADFAAPRSLWAAQLGPLREVGQLLHPSPRRVTE